MIAQLILKTLMACQPKLSSSTAGPSNVRNNDFAGNPSEVDVSISVRGSLDSDTPSNIPPWPSMLPEPLGIESIPPVKPSSDALHFYASEVMLSDLTYFAQFQDLLVDEQLLCTKLCENNPDLEAINGESLRLHLTNIDNCQMDLLQNWRVVVAAAPRDSSSVGKQIQTYLDLPDISVGVVECNGDTVPVIKGRTATVPIQITEQIPDWGGYFAKMAQEEATAIFAFEELLEHLKDWKAPTELLDWCSRIVTEEQTHTLMMAGLARRNGQTTAIIQFPGRNRVSMVEMASHNALAGCIAETWSAVLVQYQSMNTPKYSGVFQRIAMDEMSHAEFSWSLHKWFMSMLSEQECPQVEEAIRNALVNAPDYTHFEELGEMDRGTYQRAWISFSEQIHRMTA